MAEVARPPGTLRTAVVWDALCALAAARTRRTGRRRLDVVDAGGGTGGFAVPLAGLGHDVTVVDPSPDSLAAAQRRAAEAGVRLRAVQGEATDLPDVVGDAGADLVVLHNVLEYVDDPLASLTAIARVARPGAAVSVLVAGAAAAVIHRALAGHFDQARRLLTEATGGAGEPAALPRRFTVATITQLLDKAGFEVGAVHGVRVFADLVPGIADDPAAAAELLALEAAAATHPALREIAGALHVAGHRPG